jgi:hypothetical protein
MVRPTLALARLAVLLDRKHDKLLCDSKTVTASCDEERAISNEILTKSNGELSSADPLRGLRGVVR